MDLEKLFNEIEPVEAPSAFSVPKAEPIITSGVPGDGGSFDDAIADCEAAVKKIERHKGFIGIGGAPTRTTTLPSNSVERKKFPVASGLMDYFPDALVAVSHVSYNGNQQHNPGQPLHWARSKSTDESDTMMRHFLQRGMRDTDGQRHSAKMAWRALAILQKEIEAEQTLANEYGFDYEHTEVTQ